MERGNQGFIVFASGDRGSSPEDAGLLAMERACAIVRERGFTHMGIEEFRTETQSTRALTRRGGTQYHGGTDGRAVGAVTTKDEYETVIWGNAVLAIYMLDEETASSVNWMQIADARSCQVIR